MNYHHHFTCCLHTVNAMIRSQGCQGCVSSYQNSFIGVPQGTILMPLLWNIFINDLTPATSHVKKFRWYNGLSQYKQEQRYGNCVYCKHCNAATVYRSLIGSYHLRCRLVQRQLDASQYHKVINHHIHPQEINIRWGQWRIWGWALGAQAPPPLWCNF